MTVTNNRSIYLPQVGGDTGTWGTLLNNGSLTIIDQCLGSTQNFTVTSANVNISTAQFQNAIFKTNGTLTAARSLIVPLSPNSSTVACGGPFIVANNNSAAFNLTVLTAASGSQGVTVPQGFAAMLYSDGTNVKYAHDGLPAYAAATAGNPNGGLAGTAGSVNTNASIGWDYTNNLLYMCTTSGTAGSAVWTQPTVSVSRGFNMPVNMSVVVTHTGGNLLSVAIKQSDGSTDPTSGSPAVVSFQTLSGTSPTGVPASVNITSALSMTTNATGATMGTSNNVPFRIWFALFNNSGTAVLAMSVRSAGNTIYPVAEYGVASTTAISGSATSAGVWYTPNGTTLTSKAFRVIGYCEYTSGLATAGTYSSDPTNVVLFGPGIQLPGERVQFVPSISTALATGNTILPIDDTIPQITEGSQLMSQAITPTSKVNLLHVRGCMNLSSSGTNAYIGLGLFQDATANAVAGFLAATPGASGATIANFFYPMLASTVASTAFSVRAGDSGGSTITFNGAASARIFGGVMESTLTVEEIMG